LWKIQIKVFYYIYIASNAKDYMTLAETCAETLNIDLTDTK